MSIKKLDEKVIAMIAAGEVVERPASAVKELIENSIDSQATQIEIDLSEGGLALLKVNDNGHGIVPEELVRAVQPHATSKLQTAEQLEDIATLGFRGEALASLAALGNMSIRSRTPDASEGAVLSLQGSWKKEKPKKCVMGMGTEVAVRDLFVHAPARRKFMRKPQTEWAYCDTQFRGLALSHNDISFSLARDGKQRLSFPAQSVRERVTAVMGKSFDNASYFESTSGPLSISGFVNIDGYANHSRQYVILNGRSIKDKFLRQAIRQACKDVMRGHDIPYVIYIDIPAKYVDVNAHPAKLEVRFLEPHAIFSFVNNAVGQAIKKPVGHNNPIELPTPSKRRGAASPSQELAFDSLARLAQSYEEGHPGSLQDFPLGSSGETSLPQQSLLGPNEDADSIVDESGLASEDKVISLGRAVCLLHGVYLLAENEKGLVVVDIHAAHERVLYEELKEQASKQVKAQKFITLIELDLSPVALDALAEHRGLLDKLGFSIVNQDGVEHLSTLPRLLADKTPDPAGLTSKCLEELAEHGESHSDIELRNKILSSIACHSAVRGEQDYVPLEDLNLLLRKMEVTLRSGKCNHGRPTWRVLRINDLDRYFERGQ